MKGPFYKWSGWDCEHQYLILFFEQSYNEWTLVRVMTKGGGGQKSQKINDVFYERRQQKKFDIFGSFDFCQSISI